MKKHLTFLLLMFVALTSLSQTKYSTVGGVQTNYKGQYAFSITLDEKNNTLSFETDAPVSVVTLETYTRDELISRKGIEYTNTHKKRGNRYYYDLSSPLLKDKFAYWLKIAIGKNGSPYAEYFFKKTTEISNETQMENTSPDEEIKNAEGSTVINTNINCTDGKTSVTKALKQLEGVNSVAIDIRTGKLIINYSSDGTPYSEILSTINQSGFDANNQKTKNSSLNPCKGRNDDNETPPVQLGKNLLDAVPGYKRKPIKFVPIQPDMNKGYSDSKIYSWTDPNGNTHTATGKEVLDEVNKLEKSLNERGHSLREKKPFEGLTLQLNQIAKNDFSKCLIKKSVTKLDNSPKYKIGNLSKPPKFNVVKNMTASLVYSYVGNIITNAPEFKVGWLDNSTILTLNGNDASAKMELVFQPALFAKLFKCDVSLSETLNGNTLLTTSVNIKKPAATIHPAAYTISYGEADEPQYMAKDYSMRIYDLVFANAAKVLPNPTKNPKPYYVTLKFYDAGGKLVSTIQPNQLVLNNQLPMPINIPSIVGKKFNGFNYELLDPGLHSFGFYANSKGYTADYFSNGIGYDGIEKKSSVSGNMEIGVKYYNWERLIDNNAPLTKEFVLFGYDLHSEENYSKPDNGLPPIRIKGMKTEDPDNASITLIGKTYNLANTEENTFSETIGMNIANVDFFIGPVPCNISVSISGSTSMKIDYQSSSYCDIKATLVPHADITMHGSGGMDAKIAYAKVFADINLLNVDMPYVIEVNNTEKKVNIDPQLKVGGLSGQVYFQAGFCIPIPLVDDICESFRIDILNWKGVEKTFKIDQSNGITL